MKSSKLCLPVVDANKRTPGGLTDSLSICPRVALSDQTVARPLEWTPANLLPVHIHYMTQHSKIQTVSTVICTDIQTHTHDTTAKVQIVEGPSGWTPANLSPTYTHSYGPDCRMTTWTDSSQPIPNIQTHTHDTTAKVRTVAWPVEWTLTNLSLTYRHVYMTLQLRSRL